MKRKVLRSILILALVAGPIILGAAVESGGSLRAESGECWRIDLENCVSCGACWGMYDWIIEEGPNGMPRFIDPNECGTVGGYNQSMIVIAPSCEQLFREIDDTLPYDWCIMACDE